MAACFFFNDTATTEIYTLSLHDALPISAGACVAHLQLRGADAHAAGGNDASAGGAGGRRWRRAPRQLGDGVRAEPGQRRRRPRSEEHTSELQSRQYLVCRLLLEKKKTRQ